jgi:hypothetical protein
MYNKKFFKWEKFYMDFYYLINHHIRPTKHWFLTFFSILVLIFPFIWTFGKRILVAFEPP